MGTLERSRAARFAAFLNRFGNLHLLRAASRVWYTNNCLWHNTLAIDYRATNIYGIGKGHAPLIVLHWAALKRSSEYIKLAKIN